MSLPYDDQMVGESVEGMYVMNFKLFMFIKIFIKDLI